ncbi:uroporphyrinogen decarboxylase family protein [Mucisphaera calidilacus]|uniref:Methylcobalamin:coenzyme M methyltransferase n=1 Tax=Mucisphaera calidilacus TaxID=2527982 RepID=A0A518BTD3_9BACT|nr:uroporphyrinogen decarboxylase family protein [Mucisphaera calidilacus]QDU70236.1 methylcobalamin:coenzyme M methyltransferase [Mucisphaera calidilacus]
MTMTGRERVLRTLEFDSPDRVPRDLWRLPICDLVHGKANIDALLNKYPIDFDGPDFTNHKLQALTQGDPYAVGQYTDEWGCVFENLKAGIIGEVKNPPLTDWSRLEDLRPPVESYDIDVEAINASCAAKDKFLWAHACPRPFERCQFLRGAEELYMDLAEQPDELLQLLDTIHTHDCKELDAWARTDVDYLRFIDDWGSQHSLLINPDTWRKLFKPMYAEYARIAHDAGKKIFMHSDGHIFDIYEDLIEIGIDAINSQLFCMDIEEIGNHFKGRITFWGEIDRQHILPNGTPDDCRNAVQRVADALWSPQGGVIAQFEAAEAPLENYDAVYDQWSRVGQVASSRPS